MNSETHQHHFQWVMATLSQEEMRPGREVDDSSSTVKAVNEQNHNSMSCLSECRANGYLVLPYSGSSTVQLVTSSISIIIRSDVSCKSRTMSRTLSCRADMCLTCVCLHWYLVSDRDAMGA